MKVDKRIFLLIGLYILGIGYLQAKVFSKHSVYLKGETLNDLPTIAEWFTSNQEALSKEPIQVILQFNVPLSSQQREFFKNNGITLGEYIPDRAWVATVSNTVNQTVLRSDLIAGIVNVQPEWKAENYLWQKARANTRKIEVIVSVDDAASISSFKTIVNELGGKLLQDNDLDKLNVYKILIPSDKLRGLAAWHGVKYISPASQDIPLNLESKAAAKVNLGSLPAVFGGYGLTGKGVTVGIGDNAPGIGHIDLKDRVINYVPTPYANHGVHISGITGGAGIIDPKGEGAAPRATIINHLFSNVWEQTTEMHQTHNMSLTNNSYAAVVGDCNYAGTYDVNSRALDQVALQHPDVLHIFAAGNDGYLDCPPYPKGFKTINGGYQPAKNIIVVTSTNKRYENAIDGSRGPVKDGRLKPEMTAVGVDVYSTTRAEEYLVAGGTSMACPGVTGAVALLTERYRQLNGNINPRADILKTLILNGTTDIGNPGPDYRYGFGFMNLYRSLQMLDNNRFVTNAISTGAQQDVIITVPSGTAQLKVMLCWHDAPASLNAANQLVNDLDIEVLELNNTVHRPLILDPTPSNILNNAIEGVDRLNNCEQVVISNPSAGNYTIKVNGFNIPSGSQAYVVAYDFIPIGVSLTYPTTASQIKANDSLRVYWDASDNINSFTLEYSTDNGNSWNVIDNNIPSERRYYAWFVPSSISSGTVKMRLTRNNTSFTSTTGAFAVNPQPILRLDAIQCPGYIRLNWDAIPNATAYEILQKRGPEMQTIGITSNTDLTLAGLSLDSFYYVAVRPLFQSIGGYRSLAVKRRPNDGSCDGSISDGDMMIERILAPVSGRKFTSSELSSNETLSVLIRNLDNVATNNYRLSYKINAGPWQSQIFTAPIAGNSASIATIPGLDLANTGSYTIMAAIENLAMTDNVPMMDTATVTIKQLNNPPISLTNQFLEDFESMGFVRAIKDSVGISPNDHWDYDNGSDTGQLRSLVNTAITIDGNRSISLDAYKNTTENQNDFIGTFNFVDYNSTNDEVRLEFDYLIHGQPKFSEGNDVWVRGNDTSPWQKMYTYNTEIESIGKVQNSGTLSVSRALVNSGQNFSSSFQVKFGQHDSSVIAARNFGNGLTFDDVKIYTVQNDVQLLSVVSPLQTSCGLNEAVPLMIKLYNSVSQSQNNVQLFYRLNDGNIVNETLSSISGRDTILYTFTSSLSLSKGNNVIDVWIVANGDTYRNNDSILNYIIHNQPLVTSYPYFENFEAGDGSWYTEGLNSSWKWGTPQSQKIYKAYSGTKAWKTNLDGNYNNLEKSYLYSPCFDISTLSNPTLTFRTAMDIESCGPVLCDFAMMEYSFDGTKWAKLGDYRQGINWYNDSLYRVWSIQDDTGWHEATISLPKGNTLRLRYAFESDPGAAREGIAIDEIEVYDKKMFTGIQLVNINPNPTHDGKFVIEWAAPGGTEMQLIITDILGKEVFRTSAMATESFNKTTVQTSRFTSGIYPVRIIIGGKQFSFKLVYQ